MCDPDSFDALKTSHVLDGIPSQSLQYVSSLWKKPQLSEFKKPVRLTGRLHKGDNTVFEKHNRGLFDVAADIIA